MTIDPMAAISTLTEGPATKATGAPPITPAGPPDHRTVQGPGESGEADPFGQIVQQSQPPALETLQPASRASYLSNPTVLGEQVLQRMESLHQRSLEVRNQLAGGTPAGVPQDSGPAVMAGPASQPVAGTASTGESGVADLALMFDYALETTMLSSGSSQFVSAVNTLMRGQ